METETKIPGSLASSGGRCRAVACLDGHNESAHDFHPTSSLPILLRLLVAALLFRVWVVQAIFWEKCRRGEKTVHDHYNDLLAIEGKLDCFSCFLAKI